MNDSRNTPLLGVDFGLKRVGLSVSDKAQRVAVGAGCLEGLSGRSLARALISKAREKNVECIVIGKPPEGNRDNDLVINGALSLAATLAKNGYEVMLWDEGYTTSIALNDRKRVGGKSGKNKKWVDEAAAILILQSYIDNCD